MAAAAAALLQKPSGQSYEYVLYGSVSPANHVALLHRLRGLCAGATTGGTSFADREITYKIGQLGYIELFYLPHNL